MADFREQEARFTRVRELLERGVYHPICPLNVTAYVSKEPRPFAERTRGRYLRLAPGTHWGGLFDCAWMHFTGTIPPEAEGKYLAVLVDMSAEGLVVDAQGDPVQGLTSATSRNEFPLGLWGKRTVEIGDCLKRKTAAEDGADDPLKDAGLPGVPWTASLGDRIDFWADFTCCDVEGQYRNQGRMKEALLAWIDEEARAAFYDWVVCQSLFVGLWENDKDYKHEVGAVMERAWEAAGGADAAQKLPLRSERLHAAPEALRTPAGGADTEASLQGRHGYFREDSAAGKSGGKLSSLEDSGEKPSALVDTETDPTVKTACVLEPERVGQIRRILREILDKPCEDRSYSYSAMGHSHLDLLFLWPVRETWRKCARTLSTVMKFMRRDSDYTFTLSQAPVYIRMKEQYPTLYAEMRRRIAEHRLEVVGAFWIECDTNLPDGESLVRQLLYGKRFFREEFGQDMQVVFLPDCFGYSAALPQLMVKSRVPYFVTNKLSMNDTNRFPRYTFWWEGLDGSRVLAHCPPENSYTSAAVPQMALYGEAHDTDKDLNPRGLMLYGLGDGGGGPSYEHMERRRRMRSLKGCPPFEDEFVIDFFRRIEKGSERYRSWKGELYLERHQGTYTSIAEQKWMNHRLEQKLHELEFVAALADGLGGYSYPKDWLKAAWEDVLLYQFHDCLPGSAIHPVYEETQKRYNQLLFEAFHEVFHAKHVLSRAFLVPRVEGGRLAGEDGPCTDEGTFGGEKNLSLALCNASPVPQRLSPGAQLPAYSLCLGRYKDQPQTERILAPDEIFTYENEFYRVIITQKGTFSSIYDNKQQRELLPKGKEGNRLCLYPDENTHWDIQKDYRGFEPELLRVETRSHRQRTGRQTLRISGSIGAASSVWMKVSFTDNSPVIDIGLNVSWEEEFRMLRVDFPVDVVCDEAKCGIQFGHISRPTHRNTSWDEAKFEVCAQKWVDRADAAGGLAVFGRGKYGYALQDGGIDLCLLRSQNCPAEWEDKGGQYCRYAVYPHGGGPWDGGVIREAYAFDMDSGFPVDAEQLSPFYTPFEVTEGSVILETVKKAEDRDEVLLRFYEAAGGATRAHVKLNGWRALGLCNLLEEPENNEDLEITEDGARIRFHAFEIQTLRIERIR